MKPLSYFRRSVVAFPLAALAALAMFVISEASYREATQTLDSLGDRGTARVDINDVLKLLVNAESGERGYLLTSRVEYLDPYRDAQASIRSALDRVATRYAGNPATAALARQLFAASEAKLAELATTIQLHDAGPGDAWRDLVTSDIDREKMQRVRSLAEQLLAMESEAVVEGRRSIYQTLLLNRIGVTAMAAVSLLALFMYLQTTLKLDRTVGEESKRAASERDRLEAQVASRTTQLRELTRHLQTVREDERNHLARELHDELGALLTAAKLDAARLKSRLGETTPAVLERLAHLSETLNSGIALKRRIIEELRPSSLDNLGLVAALEILVREFGQRSEIPVAHDLQPVSLAPALQLTAYRLVQEALTNIAKYASASTVKVTLEAVGASQARIAVQDDGAGFDPDAAAAGASHGLIGMRYRVESEGGSMRLISALGQGTRIEAMLPARLVGAETAEPVNPDAVASV